MLIKELVWDEKNEAHIWKHRVMPEEVEQACCCAKPLVYRVKNRNYALLGETEGGRYLLVILAPKGKNTFRAITARDMTDAERKRYRKWVGR